MPIDLVISDLDGTILETEDYHRRAYNVLFRELNLSREWSEADYKARLATMGGAKFDEILPWLWYRPLKLVIGNGDVGQPLHAADRRWQWPLKFVVMKVKLRLWTILAIKVVELVEDIWQSPVE